jgi:hypothetical protein
VNEQEWETSTELTAMMASLGIRGGTSERKLRLFAAACCRCAWSLLIDERSRAAVEAAECYADGLLGEEEREAAFRAACDASGDVRRGVWPETTLRFRRARDPDSVFRATCLAAFASGSRAGDIQMYLRSDNVDLPEGKVRCQMLRCIFGPPVQSVALSASSLTPTAVALACSIYEERDFACLPVLADALEDAGCTRWELLGHLRAPGRHSLGCWSLDTVLGKG